MIKMVKSFKEDELYGVNRHEEYQVLQCRSPKNGLMSMDGVENGDETMVYKYFIKEFQLVDQNVIQ